MLRIDIGGSERYLIRTRLNAGRKSVFCYFSWLVSGNIPVHGHRRERDGQPKGTHRVPTRRERRCRRQGGNVPPNQLDFFFSFSPACHERRCRRQGGNVPFNQSVFFFSFSPACHERRCRRQGGNVPFNQSVFFFSFSNNQLS